MNLKHNKKRNTAVLFEILCNELTRSVVDEKLERKQRVLAIIKESFSKDTTLKKELDIYKSVLEGDALSARRAEKVFKEAAQQYSCLNKEDIFEEQSALIDRINKALTPDVFSNFIPSYTSMATAHQLFNIDLKPRQRVVLEERLLSFMMATPINESKDFKKASNDKLIHKMHVKKFNESFGESLLENQKTLLSKFVNSFADNGLELKIFLNEEISRMRNVIIEKSAENSQLTAIIETIDHFKGQWITTEMLKKILKIQQLTEELQHNAD
jgi:hypothetical protein